MQKSRLQRAAGIAYAAIVVLFAVFFIYMGTTEELSIYRARNPRSYHMVEDSEMTEIEDSSAPIGVRQVYTWEIGDIGTNDTTLAFYLVHQYAEVYFDDELMYSIMPDEGNRIGKSISSNWVTVPVYLTDIGRQVRVVITPVYESVRERVVTFELGSLYQLYRTQLMNDLFLILLSATSIIVGIIIMLSQLVMLWRYKVKTLDIFYLGCFTATLGLWKIADVRFSPFMFQNTLLLGYLSIGAMFLAAILCALYLRSRYEESRSKPLMIVSIILSGAALLALMLQLLHVADFRQTLILAHIGIVLLTVTLLVMSFLQWKHQNSKESKRAVGFACLLGCGAAVDLVIYYLEQSSAHLGFTILSVLIYSLLLFIVSLTDTNKKAYTDAHTGLFNKSRWNALMDEPGNPDERIAMIMLDLNRLKYVNDTQGHEMGDKMIISFVNILCSVIPPTNTICRWGGDEFVVMVTDASREKVEGYLSEISESVLRYNRSGEKPAIHYAAGYALSSDYPEFSRNELFQKADEMMYADKQRWYRENPIAGKEKLTANQ